MPRHEDHPLVIARLRAGVTRTQLARDIAVDRSTIAALEEGRTRSLSFETASNIDRALGLRPGTIGEEMNRWHAQPNQSSRLTLEARAILRFSGERVLMDFDSFKSWRLKLAPTPTALASLLGVNVATVSRYESGVRVNGMPDTLISALLQRLEVTPEYVRALASLPPTVDSESADV